ncbi:MAG: DUF308 domain-containing protein [Bacteroidales bacterium]|nr:DUF308 domain-containing protein [Bacteroidales bacterium]
MKVKVNLILTAVIMIAVGVLFVIYPKASLGPLTWLLGVLILASGIFTILFSLKAQKVLPNASSSTLLGVFQIMLGSLFVLNYFNMLKDSAIGVLFATWVMYEGLSLVISSFGYKKATFRHWWVMLLFGVLNVILGYVALLYAEEISTVLAVIVGLGIVANGVMRIVAFIAITRIEKRLKQQQEAVQEVLGEKTEE